MRRPLSTRDLALPTAISVFQRVIDVSGQEAAPVGILCLRDNVDFMAAFPAEPPWIKTMARDVRIFELAFEQDLSAA
jgi:hypothetical protein